MLCHRYEKHKAAIKYPWYIQPKLNGIRLLYFDGVMQSRSFGLDIPRTWPQHRLKHLRNELFNVPSRYLFDGELYVHGWSLQKINGTAAINGGNDNERTPLLEYHVFDIVDTENLDLIFSERVEILTRFSRQTFDKVRFVETIPIASELVGDANYAAWKHFGYEGAVYKDPNESYGFVEDCGNKENRWKKTLKRKDYLDEKCKIISVLEGEGKFEGMVGAFILELPNGVRFQAGSGLYDSQREEYWENPPIGVFCEIKYFALSDEGKPLQPTIEAVLD